MTNNPANKLALAAALTLLGASLGVSQAQAASTDTTSTQIKGETTSNQDKDYSSSQIKGETNANFLKRSATSNQQKCAPMTAQWIKLHPAESKQLKLDCAAQSNQIKLNQSNQIKLNQSNQLKLDTTH
jgi:hypothetical protein